MTTGRNYSFWIFYAAAWLVYAACLGAVFLVVGIRFDFNFPLQILCNVAPAALLGLLVFQICERLKWSERARARFVLIHLFGLFLFDFSWCFLTLLDLSVLSSVGRGEWIFVRWDYFATLWQLFSGAMVYLTIASSVYVRQTGESLLMERIEARRFSLLPRSSLASRQSRIRRARPNARPPPACNPKRQNRNSRQSFGFADFAQTYSLDFVF